MVARWLQPDLRSYVFGPSGFWTMAPLRYAAKFDPFLSLHCAPTPSTLPQSKERKGSNFAIWQPCRRVENADVGDEFFYNNWVQNGTVIVNVRDLDHETGWSVPRLSIRDARYSDEFRNSVTVGSNIRLQTY